MRKSLSWTFDKKEKEELSRELSDFENPSEFVRKFVESGQIQERINWARDEDDTPWVIYACLSDELLQFFCATMDRARRALVLYRVAIAMHAVMFGVWMERLLSQTSGHSEGLRIVDLWGTMVLILCLVNWVAAMGGFRKRALKRRIITMNWLSQKEQVRIYMTDALIDVILRFLVTKDIFFTDGLHYKKMRERIRDDDNLELGVFDWGYVNDDGDSNDGLTT